MNMKRLFLLATMVASVLSLSAQRRMQVWEGNTYMQFFTTDVDSVTFLSFPEGILQECEEIHDTIIKTITVHDTITQTIRDTIQTIIKDTIYIPYCPDTIYAPDTLTGVFSVSDTKQVRFSRGNLQYTQSTQTWSFAKHQYDMIGEANVSNGTLADKIDLFAWSGSTGSAPWGISSSTDNTDYSGGFKDWGKNIDGGRNWYTLTYDEWSHLLSYRTNAKDLAGVARINLNADGTEYMNGLILLPDTWICPAGVTFKSGFANAWSVQAYADYQTFSLFEWQKMEAAGAVFLPASGNRLGLDMRYSIQEYGYYWSASYNGSDRANCLNFSSYRMSIYGDGRSIGQAVRLVQDYDKATLESGSCGSTATYRICANEVLYVEGSGEVDSSPWQNSSLRIRKIYVGEGITSLCGSAFGYMNFDDISLPSTLQSIGDMCFFNNLGNCTTLYIPSAVKHIGKGITTAWWSLGEIFVSSDNQYYTSENGILYDKQKSSIVICPCNIQLERLDVPTTVTTIMDWAFNTIKGELRTFTAHEGLKTIGMCAFEYCHIDTINLPASVEVICIDWDGGPFASDKIKAINVSAGGEKYRSEDGVLYSADFSTLVAYPGGRIDSIYTVNKQTKELAAWSMSQNVGVREVILPQGLQTIGYYAMGASLYTKIVIPSSVTEISWWAFSTSRSNLDPMNFCEGIWFESSTPCSIGSYGVFGKQQKIYVPCGAVGAYKQKWNNIEKGAYINQIYAYPTCDE